MDFFRFDTSQSFDITKLVEEYQGRTLDEFFPHNKIKKNEMGEFMEIIWEIEDIPYNLNIQNTKRNILKNLKAADFVGDTIETYLQGRGIKTLLDLQHTLKYSSAATQILNQIKEKDYKTLLNNKNIRDIDVSFCFKNEDLLFLDIETLGLYDSPMIIIGLGFFSNKKFNIRIYFARDIEEELAMCEHLRNKILPKFKCFITYNGKSFDIPYIANRFLYYYDENPMISEDDKPYEVSNSLFHHIDLYHNCRRRYKGIYSSYTLTNMEEKILNWKRDNELPSSLVGMCYKKYKKKPGRYIGLIKECIEHNFYDVYSMPLLLKEILKNE